MRYRLLLLLLFVVPLAAAQDDDQTAIITPANAAELAQVGTLEGHLLPVTALAFSPDGATLASAGDDLSLRLWNVAERDQLLETYPHNAAIEGLAYSPTGDRLATTSWDRTVNLFVPTDDFMLEPLPSLLGFPHVVEPVAFDSSGDWLAFGVGNGTVNVINQTNADNRQRYAFDALEILDVAFLPAPVNGVTVFAASVGFPADQVAFGDTTGAEAVTLDHGHAGSVPAVSFRPAAEEGDLLVTAGDDGTARFWAVEPADAGESVGLAFEAVGLFTAEEPVWFTDSAWHPAGELLALGTLEGDVLILDVRDPAEPVQITSLQPGLRAADVEANSGVMAVAWHPAGSLLAVAGGDAMITFWGIPD
jgi:WD40 repeat protein